MDTAFDKLELEYALRRTRDDCADYARIGKYMSWEEGDWRDDYLKPTVIALDGSSAEGGAVITNVVFVPMTNVVVHYVQNVVAEESAHEAVKDSVVELVTEVKSDGLIAVPNGWSMTYYDSFCAKYGSDYSKALMSKNGKKDGSGNDMYVWQDLVAGTDPTDETDVFRATVRFVDGTPVIKYEPELSATETAKRKYTTYGKKTLLDAKWVEISADETADYNFFKVTVNMR